MKWTPPTRETFQTIVSKRMEHTGEMYPEARREVIHLLDRLGVMPPPAKTLVIRNILSRPPMSRVPARGGGAALKRDSRHDAPSAQQGAQEEPESP